MTLNSKDTCWHKKTQLRLLIYLSSTMGIVMFGQSLSPKTSPYTRRLRDTDHNNHYLPTALERLRELNTIQERIELARASLSPTLGVVVFQRRAVTSNSSLPVNCRSNMAGSL